MEADKVITISKENFDGMISQIINRLEYRHLKFDIVENAKNYLKEFIAALLKKLLGSTNALHVSDSAAYVILVVCLIIIAAILIILGLKIFKLLDKSKKIRELFGTVIDVNTTPLDMMRKSKEYENNKDYRNAVKFSFIAILLKMHENNIIFLDEAKTNGEILTILENKEFYLINAFKQAVQRFNVIWYGHKDPAEDSYTLWKQNAATLWEGVQHETKKQ